MNALENWLVRLYDRRFGQFYLTMSMLFAVFVFLFAFIGFVAYFEAQAFNELTGRQVSTWQAVFVQLRVDCE